jgi:hypothetical protein
MENIYYVYQYIDPITNLPFYIGKGKGDRLYTHIKETSGRQTNGRKYKYIQQLKNHGLEPIIEKIAENLDAQSAYNLEKKLIVLYGRKGIDPNGILTNICIDNRPPVTSGPKHHNYGRPVITMHTIETKKKISESKKGKPSWHKGRKKSDETRKKMSESRSGIKLSDDTKMKLRIINSGPGNPNFNSMWITNGVLNSKIKKGDIIPTGWYNGRTLGQYKCKKSK